MRNAVRVCAFVFAVVVTAVLAAPAAAFTRLVDDNLVPCAGGGLPIHATISAAVAAAAPGESIGVCAGTYAEFVEVATDGLVLQAVGLAKLVNPGGPGSGITVLANNVRIQGFDVSGFSDSGECGIVVTGIGGDIHDNRVHHNDVGICAGFAEATRIRNNVAENNADDGIFSILVDGIQVFTNTVRNNGGFGIEAFLCDFAGGVTTDIHHNNLTGNAGDGIYAVDCPATIQNNTVRATNDPSFHGIHVADTVGGVVTRNLVQNAGAGILIEGVSECTVSNNSLSFNMVGIDLFESDQCAFTKNVVTRSSVVGCQWDEVGVHTFTANACGTEIPPGAWD